MADPIQSNSGQASGTANNVRTLSGVAAGDTLVACYISDTSTTQPSVPTDSSGQTWTLGQFIGGNSVGVSIWYLLNANSGTHTLTFTAPASTTSSSACLSEFGPATATDVIPAGYNGNSQASPYAGLSITPTQAGDIVVYALGGYVGATITWTPATGYTTCGSFSTGSSDPPFIMAVKDVSGTAAETPSTSWTGGSISGFGAVMMSFKTAAAAAPQPWTDPWDWHPDEVEDDLWQQQLDAPVGAGVIPPPIYDDPWPWRDDEGAPDDQPEWQDGSAPVSTFVALAPPDDPWQHWDDEASDDQAVDDAPIAAESVLVQPADDWAWDEDVGDDLADQLPSDATSSDTNPIVAPLELDWPWDEDHEDRWEDWQADSTAVAESPLTPPDVDWDWSEDQADEVEAWQADSTPAAESPITPADVDWDWNEDQADEQESWQSDAMPVGANLPVTTPGPDDQWDHVDEVPDDWIEWPEPSSAPVVADVIPPPADVDWNWDEDVADEVPVDDQAIAAESVLEAPTDEWDWYGDDAAHDDAPEWQDDATPVGTFIAGPAIPDEWPHDDDDADDWWHQGEPTSQPTPPDVAGYPVDDAWPWQDDEGAPDDQPEWQDDSQSIPASVPPNPALNLEDAWDWSDADNLVDDWESWEDQSEPVGLPGPTPPAPAPAGLNPLDPLLAARRQWANLGVKWGSKPDLVLQAKTKAEVLRLAPVARALNVALELGPLPGPVVARIAPDPWRISITLPTVVAPAKPEEKPEAPRWTPPPEPEPPPPPPPEDPQVAALRREIASLKQMVVEAQRRAAIKAAEAELARDIARADGDAALERVQEERRKRNQRIAAELAARLYFRKP
jgi:hypothetical protein